MIFQDIVRSSLRARSEYVLAAADKLGLSELIVEKDFWAVWILERLFTLSPEVGPFTFKGGTSLSKGFSAIERFSEDVDITIGRATLGFPDDAYFYDAGSGAETKRRVIEIRERVRTYTLETLLPRLRNAIASALIPRTVGTWRKVIPEACAFIIPRRSAARSDMFSRTC